MKKRVVLMLFICFVIKENKLFCTMPVLENLLIDIDPRCSGMGGVGVALKYGLENISFNPVAIEFINNTTLKLSYLKSLLDQYYAKIDFGYRTIYDRKIYIGVMYFDGGTIEINYRDGSIENKNLNKILFFL